MFEKDNLKNIVYAVGANGVSILVSLLTTLFLPKFVSVETYGLWCLFLFYYSYIGVCHLGWSDGIYLRYSGDIFFNINKKLLLFQMVGIMFFSIVIAILILLSIYYFADGIKNLTIFKYVILIVPFVHFNTVCSFVMQISNQISKYSLIVFLERISFIILGVCFLFMDYDSFHSLYLVSFLSTIITFIFCIMVSRCYFTNEKVTLKEYFEEFVANINSGSKLLVGNIAGMMIVGILRFAISNQWDIQIFAKVSLALGMTNFFLAFINSVSVVFFPYIKSIDVNEYAFTYYRVRFYLMNLLFGVLICYYPVKEVILWWIPQYKDTITFLSILMPICIFESKTILLTNTYLKGLRKENILMKINLLMVVLSALTAISGITIIGDLNFFIFAIPILLWFRSIVAETILCKLMGANLLIRNILEVCLIVIFIAINIFIDNVFVGGFTYATIFLFFMIVNIWFWKVKRL